MSRGFWRRMARCPGEAGFAAAELVLLATLAATACMLVGPLLSGAATKAGAEAEVEILTEQQIRLPPSGGGTSVSAPLQPEEFGPPIWEEHGPASASGPVPSNQAAAGPLFAHSDLSSRSGTAGGDLRVGDGGPATKRHQASAGIRVDPAIRGMDDAGAQGYGPARNDRTNQGAWSERLAAALYRYPQEKQAVKPTALPIPLLALLCLISIILATSGRRRTRDRQD